MRPAGPRLHGVYPLDLIFDLIVFLEYDAAIVDKVLRIVAESFADRIELAFHVLLVGEDLPQDPELFSYVVSFSQEVKLPPRVQFSVGGFVISRVGPHASKLLP